MEFPLKKPINTTIADQKYNILDRARNDFIALGVSPSSTPPKLPEDCNFIPVSETGFPYLPTDLTMLTQDQVGKVYSFFAVWAEYMSDQVCLLDMVSETQNSKRDLIRAHIRLELPEKMTAPDKDARIIVDERFIEVDGNALLYKHEKLLVKKKHDDLIRGIAIISREMTRRGQAPPTGFIPYRPMNNLRPLSPDSPGMKFYGNPEPAGSSAPPIQPRPTTTTRSHSSKLFDKISRAGARARKERGG